MDSRRLGTDGPEVSILGLGCNNFGLRIDADASRAVIEAALDLGVTHFDTAEAYGDGKSEEFLGTALARVRDDVVIATKCMDRDTSVPYEPGALRRRIEEGCEISLRRLGTDRIDLYYQHHPDPDAPIEETLEAFDDLLTKGKVLHVACSDFGAALVDESAAMTREKGLPSFCTNQIHWNLLERDVEAEVVPACRRADMGIIPFFPLASGMLTGKYRKNQEFPPGSRLEAIPVLARIANDENYDYTERLSAFAAERGHDLVELAIAWLLAQDGVGSVIAGATSPEQLKANVGGVAWRLSADDLAALPTR